MEKGDRGHRSQLPLDWRYGSQMDSFCPAPWDQAPNSQMGFYESEAPSADVGSNPTFMDMAMMAGHFAMNPPFDPYSDFSRLQHQRNGVGIGDGPSDSRASSGGPGVQESGNLQWMGVSGNESSDTKPSCEGKEEPSSNVLTAKKRKMSVQESGRTQLKEESEAAARDGDGSKQNAEQGGVTMAAVKLNGRRGNEKTDPPKEDYIHFRARRGQATNSHSLAERVRREKISERMKLLQDLVPGCSKVTGKAVMLDEIINYVQSLQRQVEFLSMKLAAINPQLNFGIEGLLSKEILQSQAGPSTAGFSSDIVHPLLHQNLQDLVQSRSFGMAAPADVLRVPVNAQMSAMSMLKESKPQIPMTWNEELHSRMQMDFVGSQSLNNIQDLNSKNRDGFSM